MHGNIDPVASVAFMGIVLVTMAFGWALGLDAPAVFDLGIFAGVLQIGAQVVSE